MSEEKQEYIKQYIRSLGAIEEAMGLTRAKACPSSRVQG